jgi:hypothetical protein
MKGSHSACKEGDGLKGADRITTLITTLISARVPPCRPHVVAYVALIQRQRPFAQRVLMQLRQPGRLYRLGRRRRRPRPFDWQQAALINVII